MMQRAYYIISGALFAIVALAHLCRLVFGWQIFVDETTIPMWVSWAGFAVPGPLAYWAFYLSLRND